MKNSDQPINALSEETTDRVDAGIKIYTGLTKREYAAILNGVPDSGDEVIDAMIVKSNRLKMATALMQGMLSNSSLGYGSDFEAISAKAVGASDCLLAELEKEQSK